MGAGVSTIKSETLATAGLRPVLRVQAIQETKTLPVKKDEKDEKKERKDTTHQTVDELQNKFGF